MLADKKLILACLLGLIALIRGEFTVCPRFCKCDLYMQLNRAQCSSKRLISAEVEAPKIVQILDLSYNDITTIDSTPLKKYFHLKYLNLSHNAIQGLDLEAFSHLKRIVDIEISYNRLQYLDDRLFDRNRHLVRLNLEGNKFMSLSLKPLLKSTSMLSLNLRNSQLSFIHESIFSQLPNLMELDISQNLLITLRLEDFQVLKHLKTLRLSENDIDCNQGLKQSLKGLESQGIDIVMDQCLETAEIEASAGPAKFQKMRVLEHVDAPEPNSMDQWRLTVNSAEEDLDDDDHDDYDDISSEANDAALATNEWLRFAPDAVLCEAPKQKLCQSYRKCLVNLNTAWHEKRSLDSFTAGEAKFSFFLGAACGITCVICILTCALCVKNCCEAKKRDRFREMEPDPSVLAGQPLARQQLPPQVRRQPRRRAPSAPARSVVRYEGPVGENFISRLFGRPARHQYYRTINQNTATLIRRLSRSNLFNNRLSQHYTDRQNSTEQPGTEPHNYSASAPRPETPPPCYGDVIVNECEEGRK